MTAEVATDYLCFKNVQKSYDQKKLVVKDFDLNVAQGEFLTLL
ncbi:MAG: Fe3+/spermidine/putrescine ABC transporter ATP-binding protein, partial [SAR324 cluster bacterium]|nr:Fe3+/spermidine/putrescine ABC transporter ATP-binding protein [SAR324 cluster bacterium]